MNNSNNRIQSLDFVRAMATLGVVLFHTSCHLKNNYTVFLRFGKNAGLGDVCVTLFFILSGFLLNHNNKNVAIKTYLYKRWKSIFPIFYFTYILFFIQEVIKRKEVSYSNHFWLTIFGMDGYFYYLDPNYYLIGEWFLGAIIFLYLLFIPARFLCKKNALIPLGICILLNVWFHLFAHFEMTEFRNIIPCSLGLIVGMYLDEINILENKLLICGSCVASIVLLFVRFPVESILFAQLLGIMMFIILYNLGKPVMGKNAARKMFEVLSELSFPVFLVHHRIIMRVLDSFQPSSLRGTVIVHAFLLVIIVYFAQFINLFNKWVLSSPFMKKIDRFFYKSDTNKLE